jgi:glycosyltransferase involved in cell wall biosynthesis
MSLRLPVLVDGRIFSLQAKGGISQMWANILGSPAWQYHLDTWLMLYPYHERNVHLLEAGLLDGAPSIQVIDSPVPPSDNDKWAGAEHAQQRCEIVAAHRTDFAVVLNTYYGECIFPACSRYIVSALDFAHEELPELAAKPSTPGVLRQKKLAFAQASQVSFISNASRERFFVHYPAFERRHTGVIYLGHDARLPSVPKARDVVLHVGSRGAYKNFITVAEGVQEVMARHARLRLFVMGGEPADATIEQLKRRFPGRVVFDPAPSDGTMDFAMALAGFYVSASRYEGFGIPLLNAMRLGAVPVVSDIPVYREIAAGYAHFFAPDSAAALASALERALVATPAPHRPWRTWDHVATDYATLVLDD